MPDIAQLSGCAEGAASAANWIIADAIWGGRPWHSDRGELNRLRTADLLLLNTAVFCESRYCYFGKNRELIIPVDFILGSD